MAAPANDLFVNARYIYDGIQFGDDLTGATIEAGETTTFGVGLRSIWYKWIAVATQSVTVNLPVYSSQNLTIFQGHTDGTVDTVANITQIAYNVPVTFSVIAGNTYYFRVANSSGTNTFQMSYPVGRAPSALGAAGTNDLPANLGGAIRSGAGMHLMEATGYGPDVELVTTHIELLADDSHSESAFAATSTLLRNSDSSPAYSAERWVRVRFEPPFAAITRLRFWVNNYAPDAGWTVNYGLASDYRKPSINLSDVATTEVPAADPGTANLGVDILTGGETQYSAWLVLQAVWIGGNPGPLQAAQLNWEFDWTEM